MARELRIANRLISDDTPPFVVAELGSAGYIGGDVERAKQLIRVAAQCGCDAVKLQKRANSFLYTRAMLDAPYSSEHAYGSTYGEHREALELRWDEYQALEAYAASFGLIFFATAFDIPSAGFLANLGVPAIKIASGDLTNLLLLEHCAGLGIPLIVSTGGHELADVDRAYDWLDHLGARFALLQATAAYPCPHEQLNLRVIETYRQRYADTVIGLSDHQDGISMAPVAWMLGARIFEKHFTLSRAAKGSDNAFSLEPEPMRRMVNDLRGVSAALGDGVKRAYPSERAAMVKMGKQIVAARDLCGGRVVTEADIAVKSPGGEGIKPYELWQVLGCRLKFSISEDTPLEWRMLAKQEALCSYSTPR